MRVRLQRPFSLLPVQVLPPESGEGKWLVDYDIPTWEIYCLLYAEFHPGDSGISFSSAYRLRWLQNARPDSKNRWFLLNGKAIRTPLHQWAKERNYYIYFLSEEITFPEPFKLPWYPKSGQDIVPIV